MKPKKQNIVKTDGLCKVCIVKRKGHIEEFDDRKIYGSAYFACRNAHLGEKQSEAIAEKVAAAVKKWAAKHKAVTSNQIFHQVTHELRAHNKDAAFLFETHRDIS